MSAPVSLDYLDLYVWPVLDPVAESLANMNPFDSSREWQLTLEDGVMYTAIAVSVAGFALALFQGAVANFFIFGFLTFASFYGEDCVRKCAMLDRLRESVTNLNETNENLSGNVTRLEQENQTLTDNNTRFATNNNLLEEQVTNMTSNNETYRTYNQQLLQVRNDLDTATLKLNTETLKLQNVATDLQIRQNELEIATRDLRQATQQNVTSQQSLRNIINYSNQIIGYISQIENNPSSINMENLKNCRTNIQTVLVDSLTPIQSQN